jgi:addiction module HigA family antidote
MSIKRRPTDRMAPVHPGEMLREEFMLPLGLSSNRLALALHVPATRVLEIVKERRGISADTALRLARYFGMSAEAWMNMQHNFDLATAADAVGDELEQIRPASRNRKTGSLTAATARRSA